MIHNLYDLEREVLYNNLIQSTPSIDHQAIADSIKVLLAELKNVQSLVTTYQYDIMTLKGVLASFELDNQTYKGIIRKMGKDYPEIVLTYPHFFVDEKNVV